MSPRLDPVPTVDDRDPAILDRRSVLRLGVDESQLPDRAMSIPGIEGSASARILSTDLAGAATRLVRLAVGWGSGVVGAFSAEVELFVVRGRLRLGRESLGALDHVVVRGRRAIPGIRAESNTLLLLMTDEPIRYLLDPGVATADLAIDRGSAIEWLPEPDRPGRYLRPMASSSARDTRLAGATDWSGGEWLVSAGAEETFVLDGEIEISESSAGRVTTVSHRPGGYVFRPAGVHFEGPGSRAPGSALLFRRSFGAPAGRPTSDTGAS